MANVMHLAYKRPLPLSDLADLLKKVASNLSLLFFSEKYEDVHIFSVTGELGRLSFHSVAYSNFGEELPEPYKQYGTILEISYENYENIITPVLNEIFRHLPDAIVADLEDNIDRDAYIATATDVKNFKGDNPWYILNRPPAA